MVARGKVGTRYPLYPVLTGVGLPLGRFRLLVQELGLATSFSRRMISQWRCQSMQEARLELQSFAASNSAISSYRFVRFGGFASNARSAHSSFLAKCSFSLHLQLARSCVVPQIATTDKKPGGEGASGAGLRDSFAALPERGRALVAG